MYLFPCCSTKDHAKGSHYRAIFIFVLFLMQQNKFMKHQHSLNQRCTFSVSLAQSYFNELLLSRYFQFESSHVLYAIDIKHERINTAEI